MTLRESIADKALRLLGEGRLTVISVDQNRITAAVRGDSGVYALGYHPAVRGGWWCGCPALRWCCHVIALALVVDPAAAHHLEHT